MENNPTNHHHHHSISLKRRNGIPSAVLIPQPLNTSPPLLSNANHHCHKLSYFSPSPPTAHFELVSLISLPPPSTAASYASLKDILPCSPSSVQSPTPAVVSSTTVSSGSTGSGYEISIRNRLVKQAAWAYLQPAVSASPTSSTRQLFCFSGEFFRPVISRFRQSVCETVTRGYDWIVDMLWFILCS